MIFSGIHFYCGSLWGKVDIFSPLTWWLTFLKSWKSPPNNLWILLTSPHICGASHYHMVWLLTFQTSDFFYFKKTFYYLWIFFPLHLFYCLVCMLDPFCFPYIYLIFFDTFILFFCFTRSLKAFFHIPIFSLMANNYTPTKWFFNG